MEIWPGAPYPLGATYDGVGTNFSVFSEVATGVDLCLFDTRGVETKVALPEMTAHCWHGYVPNLGPGQRYGFRVHGPYDPAAGLRANPAKLLLDPYAKAVEGRVDWHEALFPYRFGKPNSRNDLNSGRHLPKAVVTSPYFDWDNDRPPRTHLSDSVIYEVHVKGFTKLLTAVPKHLRGTYAGMAHPAVIDYLKGLGVTAIELLPVHQFLHDAHLVDRGLLNYWGYNSICYLAPHSHYSAGGQTGQQVQEFKQLVKTMHEADIEVILDVVYNHTAEGNHMGPVVSLKGLDNQAYYRLVPEDPSYYYDTTGTGNSLNMRHPHVLQLIMDSLRYWVTEMHVDGFRFDLAATLARQFHEVDRLSAFFDLIQQDPVVSQVKLIAEPWDLGEGGYQVGNFPPLWSEWNGRFRDCVRDFWRGEPETLAEFGYRITGSADLYEGTGRRPHASVNFVTCHDGFTLADLTSYHHKRNEANGEDNRDGENHNRSWNCGAEGPTDDPEVVELRARQRRNLLATLLLSQGIPMLLAGDEMGRTQQGNNNAYCQDNEISWVDWDNLDGTLVSFTRRVIGLRRRHPVLRHQRFLQGRQLHGEGAVDIAWFRPDGTEMSEEDWQTGYARSVGVFLNGDAIPWTDSRGERVVDDSFLLLFNAGVESIHFLLPDIAERWVRVLDTTDSLLEGQQAKKGDPVMMADHSMVVLRKAG